MFDPLEKYGAAGLSYADFFLYPLADALSQTMTSTTKVLFAMQVSPHSLPNDEKSGILSRSLQKLHQNFTLLMDIQILILLLVMGGHS